MDTEKFEHFMAFNLFRGMPSHQEKRGFLIKRFAEKGGI